MLRRVSWSRPSEKTAQRHGAAAHASGRGRHVPVRALKKTDPQQLARFLAGEHAQTKALILGHLDPKQASALLMKLEPEARADCVRRMATMGQFSPEAAAKASRVLEPPLRSAGDQSKRVDSGVKNLADLMNRLEPAAAREILETIEARRSEAGNQHSRSHVHL